MADAAKPCWQELGSLGTVQHGYGRGVSKHKGEFSFGGGGQSISRCKLYHLSNLIISFSG